MVPVFVFFNAVLPDWEHININLSELRESQVAAFFTVEALEDHGGLLAKEALVRVAEDLLKRLFTGEEAIKFLHQDFAMKSEQIERYGLTVVTYFMRLQVNEAELFKHLLVFLFIGQIAVHRYLNFAR